MQACFYIHMYVCTHAFIHSHKCSCKRLEKEVSRTEEEQLTLQLLQQQQQLSVAPTYHDGFAFHPLPDDDRKGAGILCDGLPLSLSCQEIGSRQFQNFQEYDI